MLERLRRLASYRDSILVGASLIYGAGYAVWAIVAWREHIGSIPVFDAQYFAAGLPPILILVLAAMLARGAAIVHDRWRNFVDSLDDPIPMRIGIGVMICIAVSVISISIAQVGERTEIKAAVTVIAAAMLALAILISPTETVSRRWMQQLTTGSRARDRAFLTWASRAYRRAEMASVAQRRGTLYSAMLIIGIGTAGLYIFSGYAMLPQALGGAKPRCAVLDIEPNKVSSEAAALLRLQQGDIARPKRTRQLEVLYLANDRIIVRVGSNGSSASVLELPRASIAGIMWCD